MRGSIFVGLLLAACTLPGACLTATQVDVLVTTDLRCPNAPVDTTSTPVLERTEVLVGRDGAWETVASTTQCSPGRVGNIVFVPRQGGAPEARIRVRGTVRNNPPLDADRIVRFLPHQSLSLVVDLSSACVGVQCKDTQTCVRGQCVDPPSSTPDAGEPDSAMPPLSDVSAPDSPPLFDASFDTSGMDAGPACLFSLKMMDAYWPFDEAKSPLAEKYKGAMSPFVAPYTLGKGYCGNALTASYPGAALRLFGLSTWMPSTLRIGMMVKINGGSGTILERGSQVTGGWAIKYANNSLSVAISGGTSFGTFMAAGVWHSLVVAYAQGAIAVTIDGQMVSASGPAAAVGITGYDLFFGSPMFDVSVDELYVGQ